MDASTTTDLEQGKLEVASTISSKTDKEKGNVLVVVKSVEEPITFPEGGARAWMAVLGGFLIQYASLGYITSFGAYQDFYVRSYLTAFSPSAIGWIGGTQIFLTFTSGAFTGILFDRGYFRSMMISMIILYAIALISLSFSHENSYYQVFLSHGVAFGLAAGLAYVPSIAIAGQYFHKKRSLAVGMISSGSALGAVVQPIMLNRFFHSKIGFHNGVRISAGINVTLLIVATLLTHTRLPPKKAQKGYSVVNFFRETAYTSLVAGSVFAFLGLFYPFFYLQLDAATHNVDKKFVFYATSILNAASVFGRWIPGLLAPHFGVLNIGTVTAFGTSIVIFTMIAVRDKTGTIIFAIFFGLFSGSLIASAPAMAARHAKDHTEIGMRMGLYFAMGGIVGLFSIPVSGALLSSSYHWLYPTLFAAIAASLSGVFTGIARFIIARQENTWKV